MEPTKEGALVDLLDMVLVKGVILYADLIISVAEIPLVGISLRAAIAGMNTMIEYGVMEEWDTKIRSQATKKNLCKQVAFGE